MSDGGPARRVIDGRFELEGRLGGGGMGTVWRARDTVLDRAVALKEVRPPDPGLAEYDPEAARLLRARVLREARALARVDHPNVVTIHHVVDGGEDTYPWLVMELVTGGSLADRLARGPMAPVEAARLGREVLAALRAAHDMGIQHRDVKPANVLLRPDGRPVLTDFGIAAIRESTVLTTTGSLIGTPDYMAPERVRGEGGGAGSDLWSLAMMLYVAVEGHHPLRRGTTLATLAAVLSDEVPPPRQAGPLTDVLNAVLVRDAAARPGADAVDRLLASVADGVAPPPTAVDATATPPVGADGPAAPDGGSTATSYRLAPPPGAPEVGARPAAAAGAGAASPRDAVPTGAPTSQPTPQPEAAPTTPRQPARGRPMRRRLAVASSLAGTALTAVLVWTLLPDGEDGDGTGAGAKGREVPSQVGESGSPTPSPSTAAPSKSSSVPSQVGADNLLTPDGIRGAVKEIKKETGTDRAGYLAVYPQYVAVWAMVEGSDKRYDTWTYRPGEGMSKGSISGSLMGGDLPFDVDEFDWDVVPGLIARAEKDLKVDKPTSRYVLVNPANDTFDTPLGLAFYLSDEYGGGFVEADLKGRVTRVVPADR
ncbi:protein kinase [Streptomyces sp. NPDC048389]|uniref:protein kinase domain-containing protein n=1 Tax=Streptomyces sp. NPDC048389 TaxID=3154622 RepID=UPI00345472B5